MALIIPPLPGSQDIALRNWLHAFTQAVSNELARIEKSVPNIESISQSVVDQIPRTLPEPARFVTDVLIDNQGILYLQSANGHYWSFVLDDTGAVATTDVGTPVPIPL